MHARPDHSGPPAIIFRDDSIRFYGTTLIIIICLSSPKYGRSDNWPEQFIEDPKVRSADALGNHRFHGVETGKGTFIRCDNTNGPKGT